MMAILVLRLPNPPGWTGWSAWWAGRDVVTVPHLGGPERRHPVAIFVLEPVER